MEIVDLLQLVLLLGLIAAVAILLTRFLAIRRLYVKPVKVGASNKQQSPLRPERVSPRPRHTLNRQPAKRLAGG